MKKLFLSSTLLILCFSFSTVFAIENLTSTQTTTTNASSTAIESANVEYLPLQITESTYEKLTADQQKELAMMWNLAVTDYQHYLWLMQHTTNGIYYHDKHLDPSWILGMNATNEEERQKYAAIALKNERERINKELAFQHEFTKLSQALFPDEKPISWNPFLDSTPMTPYLKNKALK